jgi:hypothetical protein
MPIRSIRRTAVLSLVVLAGAGACSSAEAPTRTLDATVVADVPDIRTGASAADFTGATIVVGQPLANGNLGTFGSVTIAASQFGQRITVPVKLACGSSTGCTVMARLRLLDGSVVLDSADGATFPLVGGETKPTGGFTLRPARRIVPLETLTVAPLNTPQQITMTVYDDADRVLARRRLSWTTSNAAIATVDTAGRVTGRGPGRATITATYGNVGGTSAVVVNAVESFTLTASASRVIATLPVQLAATLNVGQGVSNQVIYRSSDSTIAVVTPGGTVQTKRAGTVTITGIAEADTLVRRSVSIVVDPFRAALSYTGVSVLSRGDLPSSMNGVWGERYTNLFAVGCGTFARWNGTSWRTEQNVGFCATSVAGTNENNVVAVGVQVWRYNGSVWTRDSFTPATELFSAIGVEGAIYAVGTNGQIHRRTDAGWTAMTSGTTRTLRNVHGMLGSNIWAVGDGGVMLRFDGTTWQTMHEPDGQFLDCRAVHVRGPGDVLASCNERGWGWSIQRWNGSSWTRMETPFRDFIADIAEGNGQLWAVGGQQVIWRLEGSGWVEEVPRLGDVNLQQLYVDAGGAMIVGNEGLSMRRDANGWTVLTGYPLYDAVWAGPSGFIVAGGTRGTIDIFDGTRWFNSRPLGNQHSVRALWGAAPDAVFAGGPFGSMFQYDGTRWTPMSLPTTAWVNGIWGVRRDSVWAVTSNGEILFYDGSRWATSFRTGRGLNDIHGRDARNIVAVGDDGRVWRFDGRTWNREESSTDAQLRAVYVGPTRTFAAANNQLFERRDGEWREPVTFTGNNFNWITGTGDSDVYAGGCGATTRRFDGTAWTIEATTSGCTFSGAVVPGGGLIIGGVSRDIVSGTGPAGNTPGRSP